MQLLNPTSFASIVASSKGQLKNISDIISKYCGSTKAKEFMQAYQDIDFNTANSILDNTVKELTGFDGPIAFSEFVDKFPQLPELENELSKAHLESEKVKVIDRYREQIMKIIEDDKNVYIKK